MTVPAWHRKEAAFSGKAGAGRGEDEEQVEYPCHTDASLQASIPWWSQLAAGLISSTVQEEFRRPSLTGRRARRCALSTAHANCGERSLHAQISHPPSQKPSHARVEPVKTRKMTWQTQDQTHYLQQGQTQLNSDTTGRQTPSNRRRNHARSELADHLGQAQLGQVSVDLVQPVQELWLELVPGLNRVEVSCA